MLTLEALQKKIVTAHGLLSVVKTMKSLAALNIRHYEAAAAALEDYNRVVDMGWQVLFGQKTPLPPTAVRSGAAPAVLLVVGSDQGMCGQFNEVLLDQVAEAGAEKPARHFWAVGERIAAGLADGGHDYQYFSLPGSIASINGRVQDIVESFAAWQRDKNVDTLFVVYNRLTGRSGYKPVRQRILPLDQEWLVRFREKKWPSACLPQAGLPPAELFSQLFRQYLFAALYRAFAHSMASENAARLAAMQAAEQNILDLQEDLQAEFRETRQNAITTELLDIIAGFEASGRAP